MKKLCLMFIMTFSFVCVNMCLADNSFNSTNTMLKAGDSRNINVWKITGNIKHVKAIKAVYDSDSETITVDGSTYSVKLNPAYGSESGNKKSYKYCAGDYYFNL